jgi:hypothetical protein
MTTIGIIGAGHIGSQIARLAVESGYNVVISNSRGPETLSALIAELGPKAYAATAVEAAMAGDIVVVSVARPEPSGSSLAAFEVGRWACKSSDVVVHSLSSSGMWPRCRSCFEPPAIARSTPCTTRRVALGRYRPLRLCETVARAASSTCRTGLRDE